MADADALRQAVSDAPILSAALRAKGFTLTHEGGGCYVWTLPLGNGLRAVVCDAQGDGIPSDACPVSFMVLSDAHGDPIADTVHPTGKDLAGLLTA